MEGRRIPKKARPGAQPDVTNFIENNMKEEFDILEEIQDNCNSDLKTFSKLTANLDNEASKLVNKVIDHLTLNNYSLNNVKNNIAMKLYKREIDIQQALKDSQEAQAALEAKENDQEKKMRELEKECNSLKTELSNQPAAPEPEVDKKYLKDFKEREANLKKEIRSQLQKWSKLHADLDADQSGLGKGNTDALESINETIKNLEKDLTETEKKLKAKSTNSKDTLNKKKQALKKKIISTKKKYDALRKELKASSKKPGKTSDLEIELAQVINSIDSVENEYIDVLKYLELHKAGLYEFFQDLPGINGAEVNKPSEDFDDLLNQSLEREKKLQRQLDTAQKNVDELKKEIKDMDKDYFEEVKKEYERLYKKLEADKEKEYKKKLKRLESEDVTKVENRYKRLLKKQEDSYKKDLEMAAQRVFELKQYISQLEGEGVEGELIRPEAAIEDMDQFESEVLMVNNDKQSAPGKKGLPLKLPKNNVIPDIKSDSPYSSGRENIEFQPEPPGMDIENPTKLKGSKKKKKKKRTEPEELAQCGACEEYIPLNSPSCPNCGAKFTEVEEELGSCGNCGNLIPVDAKKCPVCKVKFE